MRSFIKRNTALATEKQLFIKSDLEKTQNVSTFHAQCTSIFF